MISYAFPPSGGSGVQRSAKFAKYLPAHGWTPIVWSAGASRGLPRDDSLLSDLPASLEHHSLSALDATGWGSGVEDGLRRLVRLGTGSDGWATAVAWRARAAVEQAVKHVLIPDPAALWALTSLPSLLGILRRQQIDVIYSTYSPASNHVLGWLLSRLTHKPWVADFRDLWTQDFRYLFANGPQLRQWVDSAMERRFLVAADAVLAVTEAQTDLLASRVPVDPGKFVTITNGVDLADFEGLGAAERDADERRDRFVLTYVGRFRTGCITPAFFEALDQVVSDLGEDRGRFELRVVGQISTAMRERLKTCGVTWSATGYLPHTEAVREMIQADALLLGIAEGANAETIMTGKVFEYLAAGRPILVVAPGGCAASDLVATCHAGTAVEPKCDAITKELIGLWRRWEENNLPPGCPAERIAPFTRHHLAGRLASVLDAVAVGQSPAAGVVIDQRATHTRRIHPRSVGTHVLIERREPRNQRQETAD